MIHHLEYRALCWDYSVRVDQSYVGHFLYEFSSFGRGFGSIPTGTRFQLPRSWRRWAATLCVGALEIWSRWTRPHISNHQFFQYVETIHGFLPISPENMARNMVYSLWYYIQDISIMDICDYIYIYICNKNSKHAHAHTHTLYIRIWIIPLMGNHDYNPYLQYIYI